MGNTKLVKLLVEMMGADVNKLDNNGHSCLDVASVNGHTEVVSYLKPHFGLSPSSPKDEAQEESEDKEKTEEENKASILDRNVHPDRLTCAQLMDRVTHVDKGNPNNLKNPDLINKHDAYLHLPGQPGHTCRLGIGGDSPYFLAAVPMLHV